MMASGPALEFTSTTAEGDTYDVTLLQTFTTMASLVVNEDGVETDYGLTNVRYDAVNNTLTCDGPQILFEQPFIDLCITNDMVTLVISHVLFRTDPLEFPIDAETYTRINAWLAASTFPRV